MLSSIKSRIIVSNISASPITITEVGTTVQPGNSIDLMNESNPGGYYEDSIEALRAINELTGTSLYQGVHGTPPTLTYEVVVSK